MVIVAWAVFFLSRRFDVCLFVIRKKCRYGVCVCSHFLCLFVFIWFVSDRNSLFAGKCKELLHGFSFLCILGGFVCGYVFVLRKSFSFPYQRKKKTITTTRVWHKLKSINKIFVENLSGSDMWRFRKCGKWWSVNIYDKLKWRCRNSTTTKIQWTFSFLHELYAIDIYNNVFHFDCKLLTKIYIEFYVVCGEVERFVPNRWKVSHCHMQVTVGLVFYQHNGSVAPLEKQHSAQRKLENIFGCRINNSFWYRRHLNKTIVHFPKFSPNSK